LVGTIDIVGDHSSTGPIGQPSIAFVFSTAGYFEGPIELEFIVWTGNDAGRRNSLATNGKVSLCLGKVSYRFEVMFHMQRENVSFSLKILTGLGRSVCDGRTVPITSVSICDRCGCDRNVLKKSHSASPTILRSMPVALWKCKWGGRDTQACCQIEEQFDW
jgi:hypothetical protein